MSSISAARDLAIRCPKRSGDYAGAIMFGGPMSANDEHDWLRREIDWIDVPLCEEKPFLGICLGAQMLARHLGHRVYAHPEGKVEVGYYPIRPTADGHNVCDCPFPNHVYQWHGEGFELPGGAILLASGAGFRGPGLPLWPPRLRAAISSRGHVRHDVLLDGAWGRPPGPARCLPARGASPGLASARYGRRALVRRLPRHLDRRDGNGLKPL